MFYQEYTKNGKKQKYQNQCPRTFAINRRKSYCNFVCELVFFSRFQAASLSSPPLIFISIFYFSIFSTFSSSSATLDSVDTRSCRFLVNKNSLVNSVVMNLLHFLELLCHPWHRRHKELSLFSQHHEIYLVRWILGQVHAEERVTRVRGCLSIWTIFFFILVLMNTWTNSRSIC
jgi:hypothetical protein